MTRADKRKEAARETIHLGNDSDQSEDEANDDTNARSSLTSTLFSRVERDADDPYSTLPLPRYNAMLAVLKNTLYIYGGIFEKGSKEYTLDDFYSLQLDKLDRFTCLKESDISIPVGEVETSSDEEDADADADNDDDEDDDDDDDVLRGEVDVGGDERDRVDQRNLLNPVEKTEEASETQHEKASGINSSDSICSQTNAFMGVSMNTTRSTEDVMNTPLPGETLANFYARSREYWSQKAYGTSENRGKELRRDGFGLAEERYSGFYEVGINDNNELTLILEEYKPILKEVEKILAEAGLDEKEMSKGTALVGGPSASGQSRNRR